MRKTKHFQKKINQIEYFRKSFVKLIDKDSLEVVVDGNVLITAVNLKSKKRSI